MSIYEVIMTLETDSWLILIAIALLVALSAFFSMSETALTTFNKIRMRKKADEGDKKAALLLKIWDSFDRSLASILVGNNIANITASTLATLFAVALLGPARGTFAATVGMTVILLTFGEVVPKNLAKEAADKVAPALAAPLLFFVRVLSPLSIALTWISRAVLRGGGSEREPSMTEEELIYMVDAMEESVLDEQERELVQSAMEFDETSLYEILTPRVDIIALDVEAGLDEIKKAVVEQGYSRIPIYEGSVDNIIGVLYTRDFLLALIQNREIDLRGMLKEALYVHKGMKLSHLLASFKSRQLNLAVVVDEYGGTLGIVTMEDVLEELVGDIWDEDDEVTQNIVETGEGAHEAAGDCDLQELLERFEITEDEDAADFNTVGGWALSKLGHIPEPGEEFAGEGYRFTVLEMDGRRLKRLGVKEDKTREDALDER
jgi:CBS domain containing-hemolysin-like protein